jgi:putative photosynthetic complex assembly protein 2
MTLPVWIELLWPLGVAVFVWWFSTGIVLLLDGLPQQTFRRSMVLTSAVGVAALVCLSRTAGHDDVAGAYAAFLCALLVWAWIELSFLTGWVTGPNKQRARPGSAPWSRFSQAVSAIAWHELAIAGLGLIVIAFTWNAPNPVGGWTFLVLWVMRTSAKLNLFLGVRNLSEEFLPPHLAYLGSHFRRRRMNLLFPIVVTAASVVAVLLVEAALQPGITTHRMVSLLLVSALLALGILEHWFMVLPIPSSWLWRWAIRHPTNVTGAASSATGTASPPHPSLTTLARAAPGDTTGIRS